MANPAGLNPLVDYKSITRTATAAAMQTEAEFFDAAIQADGNDAIIDIEVSPGQPLTIPVRQGNPRIIIQTTGDGTPATPGQEPRRTAEPFITLRSVEQYIKQIGRGRTLKIDGQTYTISYLKPHRTANVTLFVEIHVDRNDGLYQPNRKAGIL